MVHSKDPSNNDIQFHWGKRRGVGGTKKDIRFYESFTFDDVNYSLYDCVYLFKDGEADPYIGKIVKIWEQPDRGKKVKILWFFQPNEIQNFLGDHAPSEKEIFLASGEGRGLSNLNPLEAIAGKCCVICTSRDERNPQPSNEELDMADYIYYRTFDVGKCTISEKIPDKIAGVEVKYLLNRQADQKHSSVSKLKADGIDGVGKTDTIAPISPTLSKSDSPRISENNRKESENLLSAKPLHKGKDEFATDRDTSSKIAANSVEENLKDKSHLSAPDDGPSKKMRLMDEPVKRSDNLQNDTDAKKPKLKADEDISIKISQRSPSEPAEKAKLSEKKTKPLEKSMQKASPAVLMENNQKTDNSILEVTRRPDADRSKWFKGLPWGARIQNADAQGTLVFIENLDPSYTSSDVEDIVYHALKLNCTAKVIPQATFQNRNYGQAYIIFKTSDAADLAVSKINKGCLMLPNGRPLVCSKGILKMPPKSATLNGHLTINKTKLQMQRDMKNAVSTSHYSQPNTIEYEMAMDWILIQEKSVRWSKGVKGKKSRKPLQSSRAAVLVTDIPISQTDKAPLQGW